MPTTLIHSLWSHKLQAHELAHQQLYWLGVTQRNQLQETMHAWQPTTQDICKYWTSIIWYTCWRYDCKFKWIEIITAVHMSSMKHSSLSSNWNSKYVHAIVRHSATSSRFEYPLGHNMSINTNIMWIKIIVNYMLHV